MLHPIPSPVLDGEDDHSPLAKEDVTRHFPPDFDCSQLLFSNEQIVWVQYVPRYRRYVGSQLVVTLLRHTIVTVIALLLIIIGTNLNTADAITRSVELEYLSSSIIFLVLELFMLIKDFGGYGVDIATNVRLMHAIIYPTVVCCETISYKSVDKIEVANTNIQMTLRILTKGSGVCYNFKRMLATPKFNLSYIPSNNSSVKGSLTNLMANATNECLEMERTEDAIQNLEANTPSRNTQLHQKFTDLVGPTSDEMLWGYTPSKFEKNRSTIIHLTMVFIYYVVVTVGLVMPVISVLLEYSANFGRLILVIWHIYFFVIIVMDTEFDEMITLNTVSISSFTTRLTFFNKCPKFIQCGKRITRLSYASSYPLYSYLYRTPNSTPVEYTYLRKLQGLEAKILGYTDGSGAVQFPNSLTLRVPNMHDVEWAILQKHYYMWRTAQAAVPAGGVTQLRSPRRRDSVPQQQDIESESV